ncbi:YraN family protein [Nocardioides sp. JQ2195]|nr:YraN family protein [Nocardioides sp. JQ2195]
MAQQRQALGAYGEAIAARHLIERGMVLLDHNWRCDDGEIDLVLRDGRTLVFCEVKTRRSSSYGTPHEAVTVTKFARMRRLASQWMAASGAREADVRLDVVAIVCPKGGTPTIEHLRGIG